MGLEDIFVSIVEDFPDLEMTQNGDMKLLKGEYWAIGYSVPNGREEIVAKVEKTGARPFELTYSITYTRGKLKYEAHVDKPWKEMYQRLMVLREAELERKSLLFRGNKTKVAADALKELFYAHTGIQPPPKLDEVGSWAENTDLRGINRRLYT